MLKQIEIEKVPTIQITSKFSAFNGDIRAWQEAYFRVMQYQNTFNFAYETSIHSTRDHEAYLWVLLRSETDHDRIKEWLTDLGYGELTVAKVSVGEFAAYDMDIDYVEEV